MYYVVNVDQWHGNTSHQKLWWKLLSSVVYDMLWNGKEEGGNVRSECKKDEGTDCEGGDSEKGRENLTYLVY